MTATAPAGRVYRFDTKTTLMPAEAAVRYGHLEYLESEGQEPTWLRCHSCHVQMLAPLWPGAVIADDRVMRGTVMLGREPC